MSNKAAKERRFRQKEQQRKHFDMPMRKFLEQKYPKIYREYQELYNTLNRNHPYTRDLTKTFTFKTWLRSINQQSVSDILTTVIKETLDQEETLKSSAEKDEIDSDQTHDQSYEAASQAVEGDEIASDQNGEQSFEAVSQAAEEDEITNNHGDQVFKVIETASQQATHDEANEAAAVLVDMNDLVDIMANVEDRVDE